MAEKRKGAALPLGLAPRLINREAAAAYIGVGVSKFDELVCQGQMPRCRRIGARKLWDVRSLNSAIDDLPIDGAVSVNEWDVA